MSANSCLVGWLIASWLARLFLVSVADYMSAVAAAVSCNGGVLSLVIALLALFWSLQ